MDARSVVNPHPALMSVVGIYCSTEQKPRRDGVSPVFLWPGLNVEWSGSTWVFLEASHPLQERRLILDPTHFQSGFQQGV